MADWLALIIMLLPIVLGLLLIGWIIGKIRAAREAKEQERLLAKKAEIRAAAFALRRPIEAKYAERLQGVPYLNLTEEVTEEATEWNIRFSGEADDAAGQRKEIRVLETNLRAIKKDLDIEIRRLRQAIGRSQTTETNALRETALAPYVFVQDMIDRTMLELDKQKAALAIGAEE